MELKKFILLHNKFLLTGLSLQTGNINAECVKELKEVKKSNLMELKKPKELVELNKKEKGIHLPLFGRKSVDNVKKIEITRYKLKYTIYASRIVIMHIISIIIIVIFMAYNYSRKS